jgi:hypothetical protein
VNRLLRGLVAGAVGTAVESALTAAEAARRGRPAVYDPSLLAGRLMGRRLDVQLGAGQQRLVGGIMRWAYGPGWGVLLELVAGRQLRRWTWPLWGLALGGALLAFEVTALPAIGATPQLSRWERAELGLDALNAALFGLVVAAVLRALPKGRLRDE